MRGGGGFSGCQLLTLSETGMRAGGVGGWLQWLSTTYSFRDWCESWGCWGGGGGGGGFSGCQLLTLSETGMRAGGVGGVASVAVNYLLFQRLV